MAKHSRILRFPLRNHVVPRKPDHAAPYQRFGYRAAKQMIRVMDGDVRVVRRAIEKLYQATGGNKGSTITELRGFLSCARMEVHNEQMVRKIAS